jgi:hypothetical protein
LVILAAPQQIGENSPRSTSRFGSCMIVAAISILNLGTARHAVGNDHACDVGA